jgi:flagellar M-ring protein FliF
MASLNATLDQVKEFWAGRSPKQRYMLLGGMLLTLAVLVVFSRLTIKPEFKPLFTNMEPNDAKALVSRLAANNIVSETSPDGKTISVPADKLDSARLEMASQGMPRSGRLGFELFDKMNWGQTEFDEKVNYQRALEGELERTIQTLRDVESARVHLVMPTESVFLDRQRAAKASIILKLRAGQLSPEAQAMIASLVAGAVDKLDPENVTVVDADTNRPLAVAKTSPLGINQDLEQTLTRRLLNTLEPVVGAQHLRASVNVEYDMASAEERRETYDPTSVVALSTQKSEEMAGGMITGGVPGTSSNIPKGEGAPKSTQSDNSQSSRSENSTYGVNKVVRHTLEPAGRIRRITAALLVDDAVETNDPRGTQRRKRTPEELKQIEELAKVAIGLQDSRGDQVVVQNLTFETPAITDKPSPITKVERVRVFLRDWSGIVRYLSLLAIFVMVYMVLLRPLKQYVLAMPKQRVPGKLDKGQAGAQISAEGLVAGLDRLELPEERQRALALRRQLLEKVQQEPLATSQLVRAWVREGGR